MPHSATRLAQLIQTVTRLNRLISQQTGRTQPKQRFTQLQHEMLSFLATHPGTRVGMVAKHLGLSAPSMAQVLRRVERVGWITRTLDVFDRRRTALSVTRKGKSHLKQLDVIRDKQLSKLFQGVTVRQLQTMAEVMQQMYQNAISSRTKI